MYRLDDTELEIVFIPSLIELLIFNEKDKGHSLTEEDVLSIRDNAVCMTLRKSAARSLEEQRGFKDINPSLCWEEWCDYKKNIEDKNHG
jgi:hypothetical protein